MPDFFRILRYLATGGFAFLSEYTIFIILFYFIDISLTAASVVSFLIGFAVSYLLNRLWVFNSRMQAKRQLILYSLLAIFNVIISTIGLILLSKIIEPAITKIIMVIMIAVWNYFIYKYFIFSYK